ncbi:MAG: anaerobic ribonucleoside-triphosphate reductase, partial [Ignisphaera sp.]|nr:anaerobic ribonucleoside-triphosphate reductase [Ignisphaera sp.]
KWQLEIESRCQKLFTGGVMKHVFVDQPLPPEIIEKFVNSVMRSTDVVYMSVTPTVAVCPSCGYRAVGRYVKCPKCGNPMDLWSRIVGYYRPVRNWNSGRVAEFNIRRDLSKDILDLINF